MENQPIPPANTSPVVPASPPAPPPAAYVLPPRASVTDLRRDVDDVQSMNIVFGGAIIVLTLVVTGIVCYLGNIQIPFISAYFEPAAPTSGIVVPASHTFPTIPAGTSTSTSTPVTFTPQKTATSTTSAMMASSTQTTSTIVTKP